MVGTLTEERTGQIRVASPATVVELVGPAGAGKTALSQALIQHNQALRLGPSIRRRRHWRLLLTNILWLMPAFLDLYRTRRRWLRVESKEIISLNTLHELVVRESKKGKSLILDQGPVYTLTYLHLRGNEGIKSGRLARWWEEAYQSWGQTLHTIIWLDAPDFILTQRIRSRQKSHEVKDYSDAAIHEFLQFYRGGYEEVIARMTAQNNRLRVLRFDTDRESVAQVSAKVLMELEGEMNG